jgi:uncharacterized membrane protein
VIAFFGQLPITTKVAQIFGLLLFYGKCYVFKKGLGYILGNFFSQTHLVTLIASLAFSFRWRILD